MLIHLNGGKISAVSQNGVGEIIEFPRIGTGHNLGYIDIGNGSIYILNEKQMFLFNFDQNPPMEISALTLEWKEKPYHWGGIWSVFATTKIGIAYYAYKKEAYFRFQSDGA